MCHTSIEKAIARKHCECIIQCCIHSHSFTTLSAVSLRVRSLTRKDHLTIFPRFFETDHFNIKYAYGYNLLNRFHASKLSTIILLPWQKRRLRFWKDWFVCLSVSEQHYSENFKRIAMKLYGEVRGGTRTNWLHYDSVLGTLR